MVTCDNFVSLVLDLTVVDGVGSVTLVAMERSKM